MSREVDDILHKSYHTPLLAFARLTAKICDNPIDTKELLDLMVNRVFEKAIQEGYSRAEVCSPLCRYVPFPRGKEILLGISACGISEGQQPVQVDGQQH
jgi:hypothetical protein